MAVATDNRLFHVTLISPEAQLLDTDAVSVQIPAADGMIGLLTHRSPLLTKLGIGVLRINPIDGKAQAFLISGGFAQMKDNQLTILTEEAIPASAVTRAYRDAEAAKLTAATDQNLAGMNRRKLLENRLTAIDRMIAGG